MLTFRRQLLRPRYRFQTAQGGVDEKQTVVVSLEHDGVVGLGEAVPSRLYGQTLETTEATLAAIAGEIERLATSPFSIEPIIADILKKHDGQRAALAAIDSALHDWVAQRLGTPVWRLLGLAAPHVQTVFTIGIASLEETKQKVDEALSEGYLALKVKIGTPRDLETLDLIRSKFDGRLLLDANEGWTPDNAAARMRELARFKPAMIEQPLKKDQWRHFGALRELGIAPLFADESCERPADVVKLCGLVDGVNVKFTKCGGIREALKMLALARGLGMLAMIGCFVSSSLAIAPALAIASLFDFADLDGALLLANDPFAGIQCERGGWLRLDDTAGLGVRSKPQA